MECACECEFGVVEFGDGAFGEVLGGLCAQLEEVVLFGEALFGLVEVGEGGGEGAFDGVAFIIDVGVVVLEVEDAVAVAFQVAFECDELRLPELRCAGLVVLECFLVIRDDFGFFLFLFEDG